MNSAFVSEATPGKVIVTSPAPNILRHHSSFQLFNPWTYLESAMDYQLLCVESKKIRLGFFTQDKESLTRPANSTIENPQGVVRLEMRTISLDDYSEDSRYWMESRDTTVHAIDDYRTRLGLTFNKDLPPGIEPGEAFTWWEQRINTAIELVGGPNFGRWSCGDYRTLSYTWGNSEKHHAIIVDSKQTTTAMYVKGMVAGSMPLCNNQDDIEEGNVQVKRMGDIYSTAANTDVWLGKADEEGERTMGLLQTLALPYLEDSLDSRHIIGISQPLSDLHPYRDEAGLREALWPTPILDRDRDDDDAPDCYAGLLDIPWLDHQQINDVFHIRYHKLRLFNGSLRIAGREFKDYFSAA
ncbi:hypothetical protein VTL71DRAFT_10257 [Oculimacula yallundae]|uniref:Heterokaryon incompatibility domain-containing protein n=1 Tax=Oculimacula yallundae TaxID=86028 RepID=A0ABR4CSG8_9HELO